MATLNTDSAGIALFTGVAAGQYTVDVVPPAGYTDPPNQSVQVTSGATANVSFTLQQPAGSVRVDVRRADGTPIVGAQVDLTVIIP